MQSLSFEPERSWTEDAVVKSGEALVSCFFGQKARDIFAHYRGEGGSTKEIIITCVPGMTRDDVEKAVRHAMSHARRLPPD